MGSDGVLQVIAYTEKELEEKELELRKYIQDNYLKIRNVEKELAELTLQIKLTAGPKKAALEHLRKKIESSGEKIKACRLKEEQARKVWEAAQKALKDEEYEKKRLCDDLTSLVEQSAAAQYSRLEELKEKLQALNPALAQTSNNASEVCVNDEAIKDETKLEEPPKVVKVDAQAAAAVAPPTGRGKRGKARNSLVLHSNQSGWTGAGFDVENTDS